MKVFKIRRGFLIFNINDTLPYIAVFTVLIFASGVLVFQSFFSIIAYLSLVLTLVICSYKVQKSKPKKANINVNPEEIRYLKTNNITEKTKGPACLKCKKPTILRLTKHGKYKGKHFWGCSTFPKCNSMLSIYDLTKLS